MLLGHHQPSSFKPSSPNFGISSLEASSRDCMESGGPAQGTVEREWRWELPKAAEPLRGPPTLWSQRCWPQWMRQFETHGPEGRQRTLGGFASPGNCSVSALQCEWVSEWRCKACLAALLEHTISDSVRCSSAFPNLSLPPVPHNCSEQEKTSCVPCAHHLGAHDQVVQKDSCVNEQLKEFIYK